MYKNGVYKPQELNVGSSYTDEIYIMCTYPSVKCGMYLISNYGNIYSNYMKKLLQTSISEKGYKKITLQTDYQNRRQKTFKIHRLVAYEFCPRNSVEKNEIDHLDSDRLNNCWKNLEWVTHDENIRRIAERGRNYRKSSEQFIRELCLDMEGGKTIFEIYYEYHPDEAKTFKNFEDYNFYKFLYNLATGKRNKTIRSMYNIDIDTVYPRYNKKIQQSQINTINLLVSEGVSNIDIMNKFGYCSKKDNPTLYRYISKVRKIHRLGKA